jgi:hypothetical protein
MKYLIKIIKISLFVIAILIVLGYIVTQTDIFSKYIHKITIEVLQSEDVLMLATKKVRIQVMSKAEEYNIFLGKEKVILLSPATVLYGFDLAKIDSSDIELSESNGIITKIIINMPPVEVISYEIDLSKIETISEEGNPLMLLKNRAFDKSIREIAEKNLKSEALKQIKELDLEPDKESMLKKVESKIKSLLLIGVLDKIGLVQVELK